MLFGLHFGFGRLIILIVDLFTIWVWILFIYLIVLLLPIIFDIIIFGPFSKFINMPWIFRWLLLITGCNGLHIFRLLINNHLGHYSIQSLHTSLNFPTSRHFFTAQSFSLFTHFSIQLVVVVLHDILNFFCRYKNIFETRHPHITLIWCRRIKFKSPIDCFNKKRKDIRGGLCKLLKHLVNLFCW